MSEENKSTVFGFYCENTQTFYAFQDIHHYCQFALQIYQENQEENLT